MLASAFSSHSTSNPVAHPGGSAYLEYVARSIHVSSSGVDQFAKLVLHQSLGKF